MDDIDLEENARFVRALETDLGVVKRTNSRSLIGAFVSRIEQHIEFCELQIKRWKAARETVDRDLQQQLGAKLDKGLMKQILQLAGGVVTNGELEAVDLRGRLGGLLEQAVEALGAASSP